MNRRSFLRGLSAIYAGTTLPRIEKVQPETSRPQDGYSPGRIPNEYSLFLPGEEAALSVAPSIDHVDRASVNTRVGNTQRSLVPGNDIEGWELKAVADMNGTATAVFEKHVTHQGTIVFVTESEGVILRIPKRIGSLASIRPRPINAPHVRFTRKVPYVPGRDEPGNYILKSNEDPCYENVAALGKEYIGY